MYSVLLSSSFARWQNVQIDTVLAKFAIFSLSVTFTSPSLAVRNAPRRLFASNARTRNGIAPALLFNLLDSSSSSSCSCSSSVLALLVEDNLTRRFPAHARKISLYTDFAISSNSSFCFDADDNETLYGFWGCLIRVKTVGRAKNAVATRYRIYDYICTKRRGRREIYLCFCCEREEEKNSWNKREKRHGLMDAQMTKAKKIKGEGEKCTTPKKSDKATRPFFRRQRQ